MSHRIVQLAIKAHEDVVFTRQRARQLAGLVGFDAQDQTRIATAVSEIARNAFRYAGGGWVEFEIEGQTPPQLLIARVRDEGPGIRDLPQVLSGEYKSETGLGLGITGARRLVDQFDLQTTPGRGTTVVLKKLFPRRASFVDAARRAQITDVLVKEPPKNALEEVQHQNRELLSTLDELRKRQESLVQINRELEDTNRGVVALYAELDEKADHLRRADEMKSRFLSNMSHEFRTPLHSILALTRLLLDRADGVLNGEQERQVAYVRKAAEGLLELVNDLLDIAKIEAGKTDVRPVEFEVKTLFSALRGMLRPLLLSDRVQLVFEDPQDLPPLFTDESKISQILRNFISNAIKFTEYGEVRVSAAAGPGEGEVTFTVRDTGVGIADDDQSLIFEEFTQIEHPLQRRHKGTGLGLPLTRRLAKLLGGSVGVRSTLGVGSSFFATVPVCLAPAESAPARSVPIDTSEGHRIPVLVVEDQPELQLIYDRYLRGSRFELIPAHSLREARAQLGEIAPRAIVLDILLRGEETWQWLAQLKADAKTRGIPILVATAVEDHQKGLALGADAYCVKPLTRDVLVAQLERIVDASAGVLIIDDEEASRYILRRLIGTAAGPVHEATSGTEGIRLAREMRPRGILLDLHMPDISGESVLEALRRDPLTQTIPVTIVTSQPPVDPLRSKLLDQGCVILSKQTLSIEAITQSLNL